MKSSNESSSYGSEVPLNGNAMPLTLREKVELAVKGVAGLVALSMGYAFFKAAATEENGAGNQLPSVTRHSEDYSQYSSPDSDEHQHLHRNAERILGEAEVEGDEKKIAIGHFWHANAYALAGNIPAMFESIAKAKQAYPSGYGSLGKAIETAGVLSRIDEEAAQQLFDDFLLNAPECADLDITYGNASFRSNGLLHDRERATRLLSKHVRDYKEAVNMAEKYLKDDDYQGAEFYAQLALDMLKDLINEKGDSTEKEKEDYQQLQRSIEVFRENVIAKISRN